CSIVQQATNFKKSGCKNCEEIMQVRGSTDRISVCTTTYFDGIIAVIDPESSWVARWQRMSEFLVLHLAWSPSLLTESLFLFSRVEAKYVRGIHVVRVKRVPEGIEVELKSRGIKYRSRDQTDQD
ncbi:transcription elongation factor SPT4, partial [Pisolithus croceorrhizus]